MGVARPKSWMTNDEKNFDQERLYGLSSGRNRPTVVGTFNFFQSSELGVSSSK